MQAALKTIGDEDKYFFRVSLRLVKGYHEFEFIELIIIFFLIADVIS